VRAGVKYEAMYKNRYEYSISFLCNFFEVSRSGYYAWLKRKERPDKDTSLAEMIQECQKKTKQTYGYRRVTLWLMRKKGLSINHKAVLRVMQKYGLQSKIRRPRPFYQRQESYRFRVYDNQINQKFDAEKPNEKWVTDISYIHTKQGNLYLSVMKDLFDGSIIAYEIGSSQDYGLVSRTVRKAAYKIRKGLLIHSDQGAQYASNEYFSLSKQYGFVPSMSRPGSPLDNAPIESFFGTLKSECLYRYELKTFEQAKKLIRQYIWFYNHERIQTKTGLTPYEIRNLSA
jgi:Transposase and inactivated derivatives